MQRKPITSSGYEKLKEELKRLKHVERPAIVKAIEEARAHGDLSENAEYDAAKNAQGMLEARISNLESVLASAEIVDISKLGGSRVVFGATVSISDLDTSSKRVVTIVGEEEADSDNGLISFSSPLARALIGKEVGDCVTVKLPSGPKDYEIENVLFAQFV